jgi:hypothetical protein
MGISLTIASILLLSYCPVTFTAATDSSQSSVRRLNVLPSQSIATEIETAHAAGNLKPYFTLHAEELVKYSPTSSNITSAGTELFEVHVREAEPAVTSKTVTRVKGGKSQYVNSDNVATMLVSDEVGVVAMISVDKKEGKVNGIVQKGESVKKLTQNRRGKVRLL